jgi:hypothetical protein
MFGGDGGDRRLDSDVERARVNATRAVRAALVRIQEHDPELGRHLERTVRTGRFCVYQPDPRAPIEWKV